MGFRERMARLVIALQAELPGYRAKQRFWPRAVPARPAAGERVARAAVLICLYPSAGDDGPTALPLMKRTTVSGDVHSGQISLPGGRIEMGEDAVAAALRETQEELGIPSQQVRVLGSLTPHWIPVSGYLVDPIVASMATAPVFVPDPREVAAVFASTLEELEDPASLGTLQRRRDGERIEIPCWNLKAGSVWGATAMMLAELLALFDGASEGPALP